MRHIRFLAFVVLTVCASAHCLGQDTGNKARALVGTWILESMVDTLPDASLYYWMGKQPTGTIIYDASGRMAVQFMRDPRPHIVSDTLERATSQELLAIMGGYYAYFGRYQITAGADSVINHVEASRWPNEVGLVYRRAIRLDGDRLVIQLRFLEDGVLHHRVLRWHRSR
jgi:hypothetical protein